MLRRRFATAVAIGYFLAPTATIPALAAAARPSLTELEGELMCPTCHTTLDQSNAAIAKRIEAFIRVRIAAGDTKQQIIDKLVAQFGPAVLAEPTHKGFDLLAWWLPFAGISIGVTYVTFTVLRWRNSPDPEMDGLGEDGAPLDGDEVFSLESELERV
jgi:cytochrome c-type biogenesis protein CcmH